MKSRAERAAEAEELSLTAPDVLWCLALNEAPQRRRQIAEIAGVDDAAIVKILARLANAEALAPTDGLLFALSDKDFIAEVRRRVPVERAKELHSRSIDWGEKNGTTKSFLLHHAVGAADWILATRLIHDLREESDRDPSRLAELLPTLKQIFGGLDADESVDRGRVLSIGMLLLEVGRLEMRPRELKTHVERLRALEPDTERLERIAVLEQEATEARARAKAAEKAAEVAAAAANVVEASVEASA